MKKDQILHQKVLLTISNLETLQVMIEDFTEQGMLDEGSHIYNEVLVLIELANSCDDIEELKEILFKAKSIEHTLDSWYASHGGNSLELDWPEVS